MKDRGFFFTTKRGNVYHYNDLDGNVIFHNDETIDNEFIFGNYNPKNRIIDENELHEYLDINAGKQLILLITESCNIRCKYCIYSGNYSNQRTHNTDYMSNNIAERAIKTYLEKFRGKKLKNPIEIPMITFYGGEVLLNYKLMKHAVEYVKKIYPYPIRFGTTTNATLLTDEKIKFLADNKFILSISLNGNKEENDRLRVFNDGTGTYDIIIKNLRKIKEIYPEYFKKYCQLLITIDTGTDLYKMREFFKESKEYLPKISRISQVGSSFTDWYDRYSKEESNKFLNSLNGLREIYLQQFISSKKEEMEPFLQILFSGSMFNILNRSKNIPFDKRKPTFLQYTGACVPGEKISVDSNGDLHVCERINNSSPIGNVEEWLSIPKISSMLKNYSNITDECINCPIQSICELCYPGVIDENGKFDKKNMSPNCQEMMRNVQAEYIHAWDMLENGVDVDKLLLDVNSF